MESRGNRCGLKGAADVVTNTAVMEAVVSAGASVSRVGLWLSLLPDGRLELEDGSGSGLLGGGRGRHGKIHMYM